MMRNIQRKCVVEGCTEDSTHYYMKYCCDHVGQTRGYQNCHIRFCCKIFDRIDDDDINIICSFHFSFIMRLRTTPADIYVKYAKNSYLLSIFASKYRFVTNHAYQTMILNLSDFNGI